jgi:hypothetical protein
LRAVQAPRRLLSPRALRAVCCNNLEPQQTARTDGRSPAGTYDPASQNRGRGFTAADTEGLHPIGCKPLFLLVGEAGLLRDARHRLLSARALCAVCCNNPDLQQTTRRCGCLLVRTHAPLLLDGCAVVESADPMVYKGKGATASLS